MSTSVRIPGIAGSLRRKSYNVTPEYNYYVPGVLKNAIDWASRPYGDSAWSGKPVATMGASTGAIGTAGAQYQLRRLLFS